MNTLCLVIDRLHAGYVGSYGNTWIRTPALDRLAFESLVADQFLIDSPHEDEFYRSCWHGRHALCDVEPPDAQTALAELLAGAGTRPVLLTDEPAISDHPSARGFVDLIELDVPASGEVAEQFDQTHLAGVFTRLIEWLDTAETPFMAWCHLGSLGRLWDAPLDFRRRYAEEGDPEPPAGAGVPCRMLEDDYDPDEVLGACQAYAGQVTLLDTCLGALMEFLESHPAGRETLVVLASARGMPLGEHRRLGPVDEALYGELVHVPLMMRSPDGRSAAVRSQALLQPADLWATLLDWHEVAERPVVPAAKSVMPLVRGEGVPQRDRVAVVSGNERAIRTPAWYLRKGDGLELFAKPDDRWEVNDVADRCHDVAQQLDAVLDDYQRALQSGRPSDLAPLDEILRTGMG